MVLGMALDSLYKEGAFARVLGHTGINEYLELPINAIVVIASIFFATSYLNLGDQHKKLRWTGVVFIGLAFACIGFHWISGEFLSYAIADIFLLIALDLMWFIGILQWNKSFYAKFFTIAYGLPLLGAHDIYISPHFGLHILGFPAFVFLLGSVFEMVVFTFAIMFKTKRLKVELEEYRSSIKENVNEIQKSEKPLDQSLKDPYGLTKQEVKVVEQILLNQTNAQISETLFISINTTKYHIRNISHKLETNSKDEIRAKLK